MHVAMPLYEAVTGWFSQKFLISGVGKEGFV